MGRTPTGHFLVRKAFMVMRLILNQLNWVQVLVWTPNIEGIMGMSLTAYIGIGTIISESDIEVDEDLLEDKYEGYKSEYLYDILSSGIRIEKTYSDAEEIVLYLESTVQSADWTPEYVNRAKLNIAKATLELRDILNKHNIKHGLIELILMPYYSH